MDTWRKASKLDLPASVRLLLYAISNYMDKNGVAWPSMTTLANDTGYSRRHIIDLIAQARESGWIEVERGPPATRGGHVNRYRHSVPTSEPQFTTTSSGELHDTGSEPQFTQNVQ